MSQESSYHIHLPWNSTSYNSAQVCSSSVSSTSCWAQASIYTRGGEKNRFFDFSRFSLERFCLDSEKFIIDFLIKFNFNVLDIHFVLKCKLHRLLHCSLKVIIVTRKSFFSNKKIEVIHLLIFFNY